MSDKIPEQFPPRFWMRDWGWENERLTDGCVIEVFIHEPNRIKSIVMISLAEHQSIIDRYEEKLKVADEALRLL